MSDAETNGAIVSLSSLVTVNQEKLLFWFIMDDVVSHSRKPVVCRYFAASGTCFYGNDCQFLHNSIPRSSISPTFPIHLFSSPSRSANSTTASISTELSLSIIESNGLDQSFEKNVNKSTFSNYAFSVKDECMHKAQELSISPDIQTAGESNSSLFEVCVHAIQILSLYSVLSYINE